MKKSLIVQKYGGSSLAQPSQILDVAARIADLHAQNHQLLIVVSAMGKTTDQLVELAYQTSPSPNRRELDMLLTTGERVSMALMSMALNDRKCPAISLTGSQAGVLTDESHSNARIIDIKPIRVEAELLKNHIVVLAGFQGVSPRTKEVTTLGRGGSDTTAVAMAAYFRAERCEILKDVEGVYSADPQIIPQAKALAHLHFNQVLEMTFFGAKVLHYRSVELGHLLNIPIFVRLAHGDGHSTLIDGEAKMYEQAQILSVNSHKDIRWLEITKPDLNSALQALYSVLRENNLPWPQLLDTEARGGKWALLITAPNETLGAITELAKKYPHFLMESRALSSVTATCQGAFASAIPEDITKALAAKNIYPCKMLFSAMSITVVVAAGERELVIQTIHGLKVG